MSGVGLNGLSRPHDRFNPTRQGNFPSKKACIRRDLKAAQVLKWMCSGSDPIVSREQIKVLASELEYADRGESPPPTRAAQAYYGDLQMRVGGAMWRLIDETQRSGHEVSFITLCPRDGDILPADVMALDPTRLGRRLDAALDRIVRSKSLGGRGWSILFLDCEYQESEGVFRFHWHGFASGSELTAFDDLRDARQFRSPRAVEGTDRDPVRFRIRMTRKTLENLGHLCTYPIKREWCCRPGLSNQSGNRDRTWSRPLPAPYFALERAFYDRWSIQDIAVIRGLRVVKGRLIINRL